MSALWQITFTMDDDPNVFAEMVFAAVDAEAISTHQDDLDQPWNVTIITADEPQPERVDLALSQATIITGLNAPSIAISAVPDKDWLEENRSDFPPLDIGSFWIYGSHVTDSIPLGKIGLRINAGQAFGSGTHATTHGCISMLESHCPKRDKLSIADIGCGSGILAMAAAKLCPDAVIVAVDNDPLAVDTTAENIITNSVNHNIFCGISEGYDDDLVQSRAPFDVILANILPSPLISMAGDATRALASGGRLILSGLMTQHRDDVLAAHTANGLVLMDSVTFNGWVTLVLEKPDGGSLGPS